MEYTFIKSFGGDIEVKIDGEIIYFEQMEETDCDNPYSYCYWMDGYHATDINLRYEAIAEYEHGSDSFVELTDINLKNK